MPKKTLEQYKKELRKTIAPSKENTEKLEALANECIADYPNEDLGYFHLGFVIFNLLHLNSYIKSTENVYLKIKQISDLVKNNKNYLLTLEQGLRNSSLEDIIEKLDKNIDINEFCINAVRAYSLMGYFHATQRAFEVAYNLKVKIDYKEILKPTNPFIQDIAVQNYLSIKELYAENLENKKEIYFLGENGVGKTVLLQAIVSGLLKNIPISKRVLPRENMFPEGSYVGMEVLDLLNFCAYGTARFRDTENTTSIDKTGYETLFDRNKLLVNPIQWFEKVLLRDKLEESPLKIEMVLGFFEEIIDFEDTKTFKIERKGSKFTFYEQGTETKFEHLADGYRSVLVWLCDLLSRLTENQPYIEKLEDFYGIVLVDEIDMFLHPKWEYSIVQKLREKLPNIQWFFTTHSPMLILGASDDAVFYKLYKENGKTQISEQYTFEQIGNLLANGIITSPLFGMEYSGMREQVRKNIDIDTNDTYLHSRINKHILAKSRAMKQTQSYISPETIDEWILEALELNQQGKL